MSMTDVLTGKVENGNGDKFLKRLAVILGICVSIAAVMTYLGILPWASRADVVANQQKTDQRLDHLNQRIDDIHRVFYPELYPPRWENQNPPRPTPPPRKN